MLSALVNAFTPILAAGPYIYWGGGGLGLIIVIVVVGGFDETLPDLYRRGDYVNPAPMYGTKEQLAELAKLGNSMGRFALRTNYILVQGPDRSHSIHDGFVKAALNPDGSKKWHSDLTSIQKLLEKQDTEFHEDYGTTAAFSDQLASGGYSACFVNFDATEPVFPLKTLPRGFLRRQSP